MLIEIQTIILYLLINLVSIAKWKCAESLTGHFRENWQPILPVFCPNDMNHTCTSYRWYRRILKLWMPFSELLSHRNPSHCANYVWAHKRAHSLSLQKHHHGTTITWSVVACYCYCFSCVFGTCHTDNTTLRRFSAYEIYWKLYLNLKEQKQNQNTKRSEIQISNRPEREIKMTQRIIIL